MRFCINVHEAGIVNLLSGLSTARLVCHTRLMNTPPTRSIQASPLPSRDYQPCACGCTFGSA